MSQQKILVAVCIVSALVVLASAADVTTGGCLSNLQDLAGTYGQKLQKLALKFAEDMSKSANFDRDAFLKEINEVVSGYTSLANPQTSLTPKKIYDSLTDLGAKQLSIFTKYIFNTGITTGSMTAGSTALAALLALNTGTMSDISSACIPGSA